MKIEMTVKSGNETIVTALQSVATSFTRQDYAVDSSSLPIRNFGLAVNFDKPSIQIVRAFIKNKGGVNGQIVITDSYGKVPARKMEFTSAIIDSMTDQFTTDYSTMYITLRCSEMIIDGLKIEL